MDLISNIKDSVKKKRIFWSEHSIDALEERMLNPDDIINSIINGEVIEKYPDDRPFPSCLILGSVNKKYIHIVVGYNEKKHFSHIITNYEPSLDIFETDLKTRRKKK